VLVLTLFFFMRTLGMMIFLLVTVIDRVLTLVCLFLLFLA
jgi:hypothetical protein